MKPVTPPVTEHAGREREKKKRAHTPPTIFQAWRVVYIERVDRIRKMRKKNGGSLSLISLAANRDNEIATFVRGERKGLANG